MKAIYGQRIVGDCVAQFAPGDMIIIGPNIPHVYLNDEIYYKGINKLKAKVIVVYFNKDIFRSSFYELMAIQKITTLFNHAAKGIYVIGKTNELIAKRLEKLTRK